MLSPNNADDGLLFAPGLLAHAALHFIIELHEVDRPRPFPVALERLKEVVREDPVAARDDHDREQQLVRGEDNDTTAPEVELFK